MKSMIGIILSAMLVYAVHANSVAYHLPGGETVAEEILETRDSFTIKTDNVIFVGDYAKGISVVKFTDDVSNRCFVTAMAATEFAGNQQNTEEDGDMEGIERQAIVLVDTGVEADASLLSDEAIDVCKSSPLVWAVPRKETSGRQRRGCVRVCAYVCRGGVCGNVCYNRCW